MPNPGIEPWVAAVQGEAGNHYTNDATCLGRSGPGWQDVGVEKTVSVGEVVRN